MTDHADTPGRPESDTSGAPPDPERTPVLVTTAEAAQLVGVNVRTVRRWIERGYLPAETSPHGSRVSPADLPLAKQRAALAGGGGRPPLQYADNRGAREDSPFEVSDTRAGAYPPAPTATAMAQLEAIRDQFIAPLVNRIEELGRESGRLTAERDHERAARMALEDERAELRAELEILRGIKQYREREA